MEDIAKAEAQRVVLARRMLSFLERYDLLLTPATVVPPYPIEERYVASCNGVEFDNYIHWCSIAYAITLVCCPALSLPCGFTSEHLPVGLQIVGPSKGEAQLLSAANALEAVLGLRDATPIDPRA